MTETLTTARLCIRRMRQLGPGVVAIALDALAQHGCARVSPPEISGEPGPTLVAQADAVNPSVEVPKVAKVTGPKVLKTYGRLPLSFEANQGQTDDQVKFLARGRGYTLFLTPT